MTKALAVLGIVMVAIGALWALQGLGMIGGSFMTGERQWVVVGMLTGLAGATILLWTSLRRP